MIRRRLLPALIGLALGLGLGVFIAWYVWPVTYTGAPASVLAPGWKNEAIWMAAQAYAYDGDLEAASGRLAPVFGSVDLGPIVRERAERAIADGFPPIEIARIVRLAAAYGARAPQTDPYLNQAP
ncbi:MAG TPA: hypothetical protein VJG32_06585 [Anaerolineae bacterium]|nr:hypothetical protein [Anaerolineae bacterium]